MDQKEEEHQPAPIEPGHVMSKEKYEQMVEAQQK
jgi:hypothetical protein